MNFIILFKFIIFFFQVHNLFPQTRNLFFSNSCFFFFFAGSIHNSHGLLAQSEARVLRKDEVLGSKPRWSNVLTFCVRPDFRAGVRLQAVPLSYGHTTVKAPHPIRTAKLSIVGPDQYFGRGLQGNLGCCMSFFFFFLCKQVLFFLLSPNSF